MTGAHPILDTRRDAAMPLRRWGHGVLPTLLAASVVVFAGCKSSPTKYVSPRVIGTVLDSQTRQPLKDVRVRRLGGDREMDPNIPPRGGQVMARPSAIFTSADGTFVLDSVIDLTVFRKVGWYSVSLSFERPGYELMVATYGPTNATPTPKGEPVVNAGNILLPPLSK